MGTVLIVLSSCLCLAFAPGGAAFAAEMNQDDTTGSTMVSATVAPSYTVAIPAVLSIPFGSAASQTLTVAAASAPDFRIAATGRVEVSVSTSSGAFALSNGADTIAYTVMSPGVTAQNGVVASLDTAGQSKNIGVTVSDWTTAHTSGTYSQSLIFTLEYYA